MDFLDKIKSATKSEVRYFDKMVFENFENNGSYTRKYIQGVSL